MVLDLTDAEAYAWIRDHDRLSALAETDDDLLAVLEQNIQDEEAAYAAMAQQQLEEDEKGLEGLGDEGNSGMNGGGSLDGIGDNLGGIPPDEFPSIDENLPTEHNCPECGYKWSGKA